MARCERRMENYRAINDSRWRAVFCASEKSVWNSLKRWISHRAGVEAKWNWRRCVRKLIKFLAEITCVIERETILNECQLSHHWRHESSHLIAFNKLISLRVHLHWNVYVAIQASFIRLNQQKCHLESISAANASQHEKLFHEWIECEWSLERAWPLIERENQKRTHFEVQFRYRRQCGASVMQRLCGTEAAVERERDREIACLILHRLTTEHSDRVAFCYYSRKCLIFKTINDSFFHALPSMLNRCDEDRVHSLQHCQSISISSTKNCRLFQRQNAEWNRK